MKTMLIYIVKQHTGCEVANDTVACFSTEYEIATAGPESRRLCG